MRPLIRTPNVRRFVGPIAACCKHYGFDLDRALNTVDGDEVSIYAIDAEHPYPLVGEVFDYNAGVSWLARWDEQGIYRGTDRATTRHSLQTNSRPHVALDGGANPRPVNGGVGDYESFGPHFVNVSPAGEQPHLDDAVPTIRGMDLGGYRSASDAQRIIDHVFGNDGPIRGVKPTPAPTKQPEVNADQSDHFVRLLGKACAHALLKGEANPQTIADVAAHATRLFSAGLIRVHSEVPSISFTALRTMIDMMLGVPGSYAVIDLVHAQPTQPWPVDPRLAERGGKAMIDRAQRTSRPGGLDA